MMIRGVKSVPSRWDLRWISHGLQGASSSGFRIGLRVDAIAAAFDINSKGCDQAGCRKP